MAMSGDDLERLRGKVGKRRWDRGEIEIEGRWRACGSSQEWEDKERNRAQAEADGGERWEFVRE